MIYWADTQQTDFNLNCLDQMSNAPLTHDNIFDTLLSIMSVRSKAYINNSDPFIGCKSQSAIARTTMITEPQLLTTMEIID